MTQAAIIALICSILSNIIFSIFSFIIDIILITQSYLPTDVFRGILDIAKEPFTQFLPYVNWFIPLDYAVTLMSVVLDAYALFVVWKYFKKIISAVIGNYNNGAKILSALLK